MISDCLFYHATLFYWLMASDISDLKKKAIKTIISLFPTAYNAELKAHIIPVFNISQERGL